MTGVTQAQGTRFYGSFLELALADAACTRNALSTKNSVWQRWVNQRPAFTFATARRALCWIIQGLSCRHVWLPAYICREVPAALANTACEVQYYAVGSRLELTAETLRGVAPGDAVLCVHYFGRPPQAAFAQALQDMQDVTVIEDCAHSLLPPASAAHWRIFSPRKLLGVPDGGLAVHLRGPCPAPPELTLPEAADIMERCAPVLLGLEDTKRRLGQHATYRHSEERLALCGADMLRLSLWLLHNLDADAAARQRRKNGHILHDILEKWHLWPQADEDYTPLACVLHVPDPATLARNLAAQGIFCARHWATLPSPPTFAEAHSLAGYVISIPCDQRMTTEDAYRVGTAVHAQLAAQS